jgi:hypothetical protein
LQPAVHQAPSLSTETAADLLAQMDEATITRSHWKIMFISGMGFLTDTHDLFISVGPGVGRACIRAGAGIGAGASLAPAHSPCQD